MLRRVTAWLIALAVVANLGAMTPMIAHAEAAPGAAAERAPESMAGMDMASPAASPLAQPAECPGHPAHSKAFDGCGGCAFCAGAALPALGAEAWPLRFARMSPPAPPRHALPVQDPTGPLERPPKANG